MIKKIVAVLIICSAINFPVSACTLFAATGDAWVAGGGTIIAKNRDWTPTVQEVKLVHNNSGYSYYGLFAPGVKAGINEKGLVVLSASASSIPKLQRSSLESFKGLNKYLLSNFATVDEALQDMSIFYGPRFIMLGDKNKVAYIEIGPKGQSVTIKETGILTHTNHYINEDMVSENVKIANTSTIRYARINELLSMENRSFDLDKFIMYSHDKNAGKTNSIWRDGNSSTSTQTLGVFIVYLPKEGSPTIYVKVRKKPDQQGQEDVYWLRADDIF